jgi:transforming growth factor-beta-induced protein
MSINIKRLKSMKNKKNFIKIFSVLTTMTIFLLSACEEKVQTDEKNIVEVLSTESDLSTMFAAINYGMIGNLLENYSPFTVFAPSNEAFDEFFTNLGVSGIEDLSSETLDSIILYHMLGGEVQASLFENGFVSTLSAGPDFQPMVMLMSGYKSTLNVDATITGFNIMASNGVIHVIDKVLLFPTVLDILNMDGGFKHFVEAMNKAEMDSIMIAKGPYTIFAPTDEAFEELFTDRGMSGIDDMTKEQLVPILQFHIARGNLESADLNYSTISTLNGDVVVDLSSSYVINSSANVTEIDLQGKNGVVHSINKVLIPGN